MTRLRIASLAALVLASAGCAYSEIGAVADPSTGVPWLPVLPDPGRVDACQACAVQKCGVPHAACLQDDGCRALLACKGQCADPSCLQTCTAEHGYSPWYDDLWACVLTDKCAKPCMRGENFACVDNYEALRAATGAERFPVRFHFKNPRTGLAYAYPGDQRDEQFLVGAAARSCPPQTSASMTCQPIDSGTVKVTNTVQLDVIAHPVTRYFTGTLETELADASQAAPTVFKQLDGRDRYMPPPIDRATELRFYVFWPGWVRDAVSKVTGQILDFQTAAPLAIYLEDCMGAPAQDIRFELPAQPGLQVLHQVSDGSFGDQTDTGSAMIGDVVDPARSHELVIQAVQVASQKVVAQRNAIYVRPGWTTHVWLSPRPAL
jgi:hypothetical protein